MQSSHTSHVNKTANFKTLTVLVTLRSGYCRIMFFSARRRERLGRGTGGRWTTGVTAGTAKAARAWFFGVNTHSSSSLSDSESVTSGRDDGDCWPAAGVDNKRGGGRHNVFAVNSTLRATSQWLSHVHIVKWPCCHPMQLGPPEVLDFVAAQHAVA